MGRFRNGTKRPWGAFPGPPKKKTVRQNAEKMSAPVVDVAVHGGGVAGFYQYGLIATLAELERAGAVRVRRYHAVSAGAVLCACALCFPEPERLSAQMRGFAEDMFARRDAWIVDGTSKWLEDTLPSDAHTTCSDRLYVTYIDTARRARQIVSAYASRAELIAAIVASCSLPVFCAPLSCVWSRWDGLWPLVVDDGATVTTVWGAMPHVYATVALNAPFLWWAQPMRLAMPRAAIERAVRDGFAPNRVDAIGRAGLGALAGRVRAAADTALARYTPLGL
jgi:hypothetical protein